tara:strand:- start:1015 stop:1353 length:339 start_codon:yes stop_codon:yes gene_type:complete
MDLEQEPLPMVLVVAVEPVQSVIMVQLLQVGLVVAEWLLQLRVLLLQEPVVEVDQETDQEPVVQVDLVAVVEVKDLVEMQRREQLILVVVEVVPPDLVVADLVELLDLVDQE